MSERRTLSMARVPDVSPPRSFPYCVVWTPIPVVSWLLPFIGHMGICTSTGRVLDFAASFYVSADAMAFGNPTRYWQLDPARASALLDTTHPAEAHENWQAWDETLQAAVLVFQQRSYSFLTGNCHSFVAHAMNAFAYDGSERWNAVSLTLAMLRRGSVVSLAGLAKQWLPWTVLMAAGLYFLGKVFLLSWLCSLVLSCGWFIGHSLLSKDTGAQPIVPTSGLHTAYSV